MHKSIFITLFTLMVINRIAAQANADSVIKAEKSFAAYALQHNTKDAFMLFMDSANSVEFSEGDVKKSYEKWSLRKPDSTRLIWRPAFAGIAVSGDIGFTTGPWEYRKSAKEPIISTGNFATIWFNNGDGNWRYLVDIGTEGSPAYAADTIQKLTSTYSDIGAEDAMTTDRKFIQQYESLRTDVFKNFVTADSWFVLQGKQPLKGAQQILGSLSAIPTNMQFIQMGGGTSSAGDIAYVYGSVRHGTVIGNYLRVWQKTKDGFKLVLMVLTV